MRDFTPLDWTRVFEYGANENALGVRSSYSEGKVENGKLVYLLLRVFLKVFFFPFPHYVPPPGIKVCKCTCTLRETKLRAHACHMTRALCARALACAQVLYARRHIRFTYCSQTHREKESNAHTHVHVIRAFVRTQAHPHTVYIRHLNSLISACSP